MPRLLALILCASSLPAIAFSDSFEVRLQQGFATLQGGDSDAALTAFLELQVEQPDSPKVQYGIASAWYVEALTALASGEEGAKGLEKMADARAHFESMDTAADSAMSGLASFGTANSTVQIARHSEPMENYEETVDAFKESIRGYERALDQYPDLEVAKTNLNHARYALKTMLQNPPPKQQQEEEGDGDEGDEGDQGEPGEDGSDNEQGEDEQDPSDDGNDQDEQGDPEDDDGDVGEGQESQADMTQEPLSRQNIEAILESLEDRNREEQKNMRRADEPSRMQGGKWW
ncbi:MAG: hypothetical protein IID08_06855 [Candidatus Hydrogenedentes bacterium]|nr:hypothetical protein [Candidatus Hydrogenedentota bacterium]